MNDLTITRSALFLILLVSLAGCDLFGPDDDDDIGFVTTGVVVGNGGNFGDQNGSVSIFDVTSQSAFQLAPVDAFVQRVAVRDSSVFALGNTFGSGFVAQIDRATGDLSASFAGDLLASPRSIAFPSDTKAYVPSLSFSGDDGVVVVDLASGALTKRIPTGYAPETVAIIGERAYVGIGGFGAGTTLAVLDTANDTALGTIELGCDGPSEVFADGGGELIVACTGNTVFNDDFSQILSRTNGQILVVDPATQTVTKRIQLDEQLGASGGGQYATFSRDAGEAYFLASGSGTIYRFDTDADVIAATLSLPDASGLTGMAGVAYDDDAERLYVGRLPLVSGAPSFTAAASLVAYDRDMVAQATATVGPSPTHIVLIEQAQ